MADVLAIKGSPRAHGNTDLLLDEAVKGAVAAGHRVTTLALRELTFSGCMACGGCERGGACRVDDDIAVIQEQLDRCEHIVLASPIFFMGVAWKVKAMIDRCQVYWARKHRLHIDIGRAHPGGNLLCLLAGGTKFKTLFDAPRLVLRAWAATLDMKLNMGLTLREIDRKGDILKHPEALERAYELGKAVAPRSGDA